MFKKMAAIGLALTLSLSSAAFASGAPPRTNIPVPDSQVAQNINGQQTLVRTYVSDGPMATEDIAIDSFSLDGYDYTFSSIVKDVKEQTKTKDVKMPVSIQSATNDLTEILHQLAPSIHYSEDGYEGELHLDPRTVATVVSATEKHGGPSTEVKTMNLEYNDPSQIPQSTVKNGVTLPLTDLTWVEGPYEEGSSVPSYYTATATYSKTVYWTKNSEYTTTADYFGAVTKELDDEYTYTVTWMGTPSKADHSAMISGILLGALFIVLAIAIAMAVFAIVRYLLSRYVRVDAQDSETGEYIKVQRVKLNENAPTIELDILKVPDAQHYLFTMTEKLAKKMRGKLILIQAGQTTYKHQIDAVYGKKYSFAIDLDEEM